MSDLLTTPARTHSAMNFLSSVSASSIYMWFGRSTAWTDENIPATPIESVTYDKSVRDDIIGMKKVTSANVCLMIPRVDWQSGSIYDQYSASDASLFSKDFYVLTSAFNVYKCINNNSGQASLIEPSGTSTAQISTGDGYTWKFMYNLSASVVNNFLLPDWLPVPTGSQKSAFQTAVETSASWTAGSPPEGHGANAVEELGARFVLVSQLFTGSESGILPVNDDFRQLGLWKNPRLTGSNALASGVIYNLEDSDSQIDVNSGHIMYFDNRKIISRDTAQAEALQFILEF